MKRIFAPAASWTWLPCVAMRTGLPGDAVIGAPPSVGSAGVVTSTGSDHADLLPIRLRACARTM